MPIINLDKNTVLAQHIIIADTPISRMKGLLGRSSLPPGEALVISNCQSIHMVFMAFAIDVVFVNKDQKVVGLVSDIQPFQFSPIFWKAKSAIELPSGTIGASQTAIGHTISIQ